MGKITGLILALILISSLILAGCGGETAETTQPAQTSAPAISESAQPTISSTTQATPSATPLETTASPSGTSVPTATQSAQTISSELNFTLNDLNGQPVSLSDYSGKAILLNFWATWCGPCVREMPFLQELYNDWSNRDDVIIVAINMGDEAEKVKSFIQQNNYSFQVLLDSQSRVAEKYQIRYIPTTFLIGQDGQVKLRYSGAFKDKEAILKAVSEFIPQ